MPSRKRKAGAKRAGRRPGDPELTRQAIVGAARRMFAEVGYASATVRAIAIDADVDPALVMHYFGSKKQLFIDAHEFPFDPAELVRAVSAAPVEDRGRLLAKMQLEAFSRSTLALSMMRGAATDEHLAELLANFLTNTLLAHADDLIPGEDLRDKRLRVALIGSQMVGVVFTRDICRLEPLRESELEHLVELVGSAIQAYFDPS